MPDLWNCGHSVYMNAVSIYNTLLYLNFACFQKINSLSLSVILMKYMQLEYYINTVNVVLQVCVYYEIQVLYSFIK